jgi:hypothetical protein
LGYAFNGAPQEDLFFFLLQAFPFCLCRLKPMITRVLPVARIGAYRKVVLRSRRYWRKQTGKALKRNTNPNGDPESEKWLIGWSEKGAARRMLWDRCRAKNKSTGRKKCM